MQAPTKHPRQHPQRLTPTVAVYADAQISHTLIWNSGTALAAKAITVTVKTISAITPISNDENRAFARFFLVFSEWS